MIITLNKIEFTERADGPGEIRRSYASNFLEKTWYKGPYIYDRWHRTDGAALIYKNAIVNGEVYVCERDWYHNDEYKFEIEERFAAMGIDLLDMTEEEVLMVQMHLG